MTDTLTFYTHPMSRGRVARWMLEETGLPYEEVLLEYDTSMKSPAYLAINPMGKVPAIRHGNTVVTENAAVCAYLAELVPDRQLAPPPGSPERGSYYRWLFFLAGPLESLLTAQETGALASARAAGYGNPDDVMRTLEQAVTGRTFLVGERFSAADLYMTAMLGYYMQIGAMPSRPAFVEFARVHAARPAAQAAAKRDDALAARVPAGS
ncbi:glutathione S-transferase [Xanthomonas citri pv. mangiferaeindicae]|nr:glutathione S-transferase [Xanthomonas citri pv. mangiferaeindicae]